MNGVLILAHGSKRQETEEILNSIVEKVKKKTGINMVFPAYLQFSEQNLEKGIDLLVKSGAKTIHIVPMFLHKTILIIQTDFFMEHRIT